MPRGAVRQAVVEKLVEGIEGDSVLFTMPFQLKMGQDGSFLLSDRSGPQLLLFSSDAELRRKIGGVGNGPGEFLSVDAGVTAVVGNRWGIYDPRSSRVTVFDSVGAVAAAWPYRTRSLFFGGMLASDTSGLLYVRQTVYSRGEFSGEPRESLVRSSTATPMGDTLFVPTLGVKRIAFSVEYTTGGSRGTVTSIDRFAPSESFAWHPHGFFAVLETGSYRLLLDRLDSKKLMVHRDLPPVPMSEEERGLQESRILESMREHDPAWKWPDTVPVRAKAPASGLIVTSDGRLWVSVVMPSERYTTVDSTSGEPKTVVAFRESVEYEVFSPEGTLLGRVALAPRTYLTDAAGDVLWGFQRDEDDVVSIVRMRVTPGLGTK
jgi:hypothetical protein